MKLISLLLLICVFFSCSKGQATLPNPALVNLTELVSGLYNSFQLKIPQGLIACFTETTAHTFMEVVNFYQYTADSILSGTVGNYNADIYFITAYLNSIQSTLNCVNQTQDYANLLNRLNISNITTLNEQLGLYLQAYPQEFIPLSSPMYQNFSSGKYYQAGIALGSLLQNMISNVSTGNTSYATMRAWYNGVFLGLNQVAPSDSIHCYGDIGGYNLSQFYSDWASTIAELSDDSTDSVQNATWNYFNTTGNQTWTNISSSTIKCLLGSSDNYRVQSALRFSVFNPYDSSFLTSLKKYIGSQKNNYVNLLTNITKYEGTPDTHASYDYTYAGVYLGYLFHGVATLSKSSYFLQSE